MIEQEIKKIKSAIEGLRTCGEEDKRFIWTGYLVQYVPNFIAENERVQQELNETINDVTVAYGKIEKLVADNDRLRKVEKLTKELMLILPEMPIAASVMNRLEKALVEREKEGG